MCSTAKFFCCPAFPQMNILLYTRYNLTICNKYVKKSLHVVFVLVWPRLSTMFSQPVYESAQLLQGCPNNSDHDRIEQKKLFNA